jgi:hypothetical protein
VGTPPTYCELLLRAVTRLGHKEDGPNLPERWRAGVIRSPDSGARAWLTEPGFRLVSNNIEMLMTFLGRTHKNARQLRVR